LLQLTFSLQPRWSNEIYALLKLAYVKDKAIRRLSERIEFIVWLQHSQTGLLTLVKRQVSSRAHSPKTKV